MSLWLERGGPVLWPLLALSLVAVALIVERVLFWRREAARDARDELAAFGAQHPGIGWDGPAGSHEGLLEFFLRVEEERLAQGMGVLDTIISAAPLLGILGTVLGIIDSFELLSASGAGDPLAISGGVAAALITTASGLVIALSVLFPFNYFRTRIRRRLEELESELRRSAPWARDASGSTS